MIITHYSLCGDNDSEFIHAANCAAPLFLLQDNERLLADYGTPFITAWKITHNYRVWYSNKHPALAAVTPG